MINLLSCITNACYNNLYEGTTCSNLPRTWSFPKWTQYLIQNTNTVNPHYFGIIGARQIWISKSLNYRNFFLKLFSEAIINNILNWCLMQGWVAMKPLYRRSVNSKDVSQPHMMHHHRGKWNETKWTRWLWRNGGIKFVAGENEGNPKKNLPRLCFVHHETHMEWLRHELRTPAVGGEPFWSYNYEVMKCVFNA